MAPSRSNSFEEFSFPTDTAQTFMGSPPLWRHKEFNDQSPFNTTDNNLNFLGHQGMERRSFSNVEERLLLHRPIEMEEDDRMDLLWQDLNEDHDDNYHRSSNRHRLGSFDDEHCSYYSGNSSASSTSSVSEMVRCVPVPSGFKLPRSVVGGGGAVDDGSRKKQAGVVVVVKVLKRWLLLQQHAVLKRKCRSQYW